MVVNLYVNEYFTVIASSLDLSSAGYTKFHNVEIDFPDMLIPDRNLVERNSLLKQLEIKTDNFEQQRTAIINKLKALGMDDEHS